MAKLKTPFELETLYDSYLIDEVLGEGGAGRVYGGRSAEDRPIAVKILQLDRVGTDKRRRFKNETAFLARNSHDNIVTVRDQGVAVGPKIRGPFYIMDRYDGNMRLLMKDSADPAALLASYGQILDGVEAAHLQGTVHRDLKPENILVRDRVLAVADFGVASFTEDLILTRVETEATQRLANFQYAAPEQRVPGRVGVPADIYALGLMLNEMFTGAVPHGTSYKTIGSVSQGFGFLDSIVAEMIKQAPSERPQSIDMIKTAIQMHHAEAVSLQKLSKIAGTVIPKGAIDEPLAHEPPKLVSIDWNNGTLELFLDRHINAEWVTALQNMGHFSSLVGKGPTAFQFQGKVARVQAMESEVQQLVNFFKQWLPQASQTLRQRLEARARQEQHEHERRLQIQKNHEETRLKILQNIKI